MMCSRLLLAVALGSTVLSSCAFFDRSAHYSKTLADLPEPPRYVANLDPDPLPPATLDQIEDSYRGALEAATDPDVRHKILIRLADIEMARSEDRQFDAVEEQRFFDEAIAMYQELLVLNKEREDEEGIPENQRLMYQLSKAYALDGRIEESNAVLKQLVAEHPDSPYAAEADFRRAETAFVDSQYELAEELYTKVIEAGDSTPFYINAVYMQGWSRFKRSRYRAAIAPFTEVLDRTLVADSNWDELRSSQKNLAQDTLRISSIVFSYLDGAKTIDEVYSQDGLGERHYQYLLYANLGELYYEKERYKDSADAYLAYVTRFPNTEHSPAFAVKATEVYELSGFPSLVLPAKESFVKQYGAHSAYWAGSDEARQQALSPYLKQYLRELSSFYHAEAQALDDARAVYEQALALGKKPKRQPDASEAEYLRAAELYGEYVFTFPDDQATPEMSYLQAEAYYSAGKLAEAVAVYDKVAFDYVDEKFGADAAYNAVVILGELVDASADAQDEQALAQHQLWQEQQISTAISLADYYANDERAVPVLTHAAEDLFAEQQYQRAIEIATRLVEWQPSPSVEQQKTAWLVLAHSQFDLELYPEAEQAYRQLLARLGPEDKQRPEVQERIGASMYKQSESDMLEGPSLLAVERLLAIGEIAPGSDVARIAHYDAANTLIELGEWDRAEAELDRFKYNYPQDELTKNLPAKQLVVYQETEQWAKAAAVLAGMAQSGDPEQKRTSTYLAAELYERAGDKKKAITYYRNYAHDYPEPFDIATEARFKLSELYLEAGDEYRRDYWLKALIVEDQRAGSLRTARSKSLAAMASAKFADDDFERFKSIKLNLPIKKSMKNKKAAMDSALERYKGVREYGIADYTSEANHRIAELYAILSADLMESQRPNGLDALAMEQYEILLEEQAFPFEEKAIGIYESNAELAQQGVYDNWVKESFAALAALLPARWGKTEKQVELSDELF
ncbi:tetratricopeptide repeat protein [Agaribacterium haliotis]|uniref:tetratricopeptide repeat protein n=1 Tax=Agaribacterium haliotis TaxID=2013869 RepID=UPI001EFD1E5C|nr:tetratricopeptide repeat protein [Agaribacterium haliotis]